jgi:hypothetical protein
MNIEDIRNGMLVRIAQLAPDPEQGERRRCGALGTVDSPVHGAYGLWWWIVHEDGSQLRYRFYEFVEMKTIPVVEGKQMEEAGS